MMARKEEAMNSLIQSDPSIMMGKPVIAGTRLTVELILEKLGPTWSIRYLIGRHWPVLDSDA